jgi:hypothetical protein
MGGYEGGGAEVLRKKDEDGQVGLKEPGINSGYKGGMTRLARIKERPPSQSSGFQSGVSRGQPRHGQTHWTRRLEPTYL